jgi:tRNA(Ile)-lysidine synthase
MASSRNRPPKPDPADGVLLSALRHAVAAALPDPAAPLLIAYSGGPDSTVLLDLACRLRGQRAPGFALLRAVHVHHGLLDQADAWADHCIEQCRARDVDLDLCRVQVARGRGVEAGARQARYGALAQSARDCGAQLLLTAHHADDRIETFLLQWLRGAGPAGLAGVAGVRALQAGGVRLVRPLLEVSRRQIEAYARRHGLAAVHDPSNADARYARNALRLQVLPELARIRSGFRKSAVRSIELVGEAAEALQELAQECLAACTEDAPAGMLRIDRLAALTAPRRSLALRAWIAQQGLEAPSRARLREALDQALGAGGDGRMLVRLGARDAGQHELRRHHGLLCLRPVRSALRARELVLWSGQAQVPVAGWGGVLRFCGAGDEPGFDPDWLRERPLEVRGRTGGERLKPHALRPSRRLKHLYQEAGVPEFERGALPLLWREERLIFVARLGPDARLVAPGAGRVRIEWHGEASLLAE